MTKRRPPKLEDDPPWMRLGPAGDDGASGDDGEKLWRDMARRVTPLAETRQRRHAAPARAAETKPKPPGKEPRADAPSPTPRIDTARVGSGKFPRAGAAPPRPALGHGTASDVDARTLTKLRRGLIPVEAELDLHGATQEKAYAALLRFVTRNQAAGSRCVRVVTGRGLKADWSVGVLREAVPRWLNENPLRALVLAFSYATPNDGGAGALYVLLKKKK